MRKRLPTRKQLPAGLLIVAAMLVPLACGSSDDGTTTSTAETGAQASGPDLTALPLGDGKVVTDAPKKGYVYSCQGNFNENAAGAQVAGPWIDEQAGTWNADEKVAVPGDDDWPYNIDVSLDGDTRHITSNDLPDHATGTFPIPSDSKAYEYDRNPNEISEQTIDLELPANPQKTADPSCMGGETGIMLTGAAILNGFDAGGRDAVANEVQDRCDGHPQEAGIYHYHSLSSCGHDNEPGNEHSPLVGYALDGFGIYGHNGENGEVLTNSDLDECHGHAHEIEWDGKKVNMYHYHATYEFPYVVSCFAAEPVSLMVVENAGGTGGGPAGGNGGGPPAGGPQSGPPGY